MNELPTLDERVQGIRQGDRTYVATDDIAILMRRVARIYLLAKKREEATAVYRIAEAFDLQDIEVVCPTVDATGEGW